MTMHSRRWISQFRLWRLALRSVGGGQELVVAAPGGVRLGSAEELFVSLSSRSRSFLESFKEVRSFEVVPGVIQGDEFIRGQFVDVHGGGRSRMSSRSRSRTVRGDVREMGR